MYRRPVNKQKSAKKFRNQVRKTQPMNVRKNTRGGTRL